MYRRTKNCKIVIFLQKLLKIVTNKNGDKISLQNVDCKFAYLFLDRGVGVALSKSDSFLGLFHENRASLNKFDTD